MLIILGIYFVFFTRYPCTSLALYDDLIVAGYASGHLRVFSVHGGGLRCEADAHARCVTSVDVARGSGLVLSTGEDTFIRIWQILETGEVFSSLIIIVVYNVSYVIRYSWLESLVLSDLL